jgi:succinate dehydrogenase / fumarate reductase, iron-sulfur subunit
MSVAQDTDLKINDSATTVKARELQLHIWRFDPEVDKKPYMKHYTVNTADVPGKMLLNVLEYIREHMDASLALRRSCGEGVCGSDGMNINGTNGLACVAQIANLPDKITLRPLPAFPVIKDLVVDLSNFYKQLAAVEPYLKNDQPVPEKERLQSPEDRAKLDGLYECILCACCTSSCPSYWWNPDKFLGPAALLAARRFEVDSRDTAKKERLQQLDGPFKALRCRTIMACSNVCPKDLEPSVAIGELRRDMLEEEA